jgi:cytochrome c biogenesis protein CcdA
VTLVGTAATAPDATVAGYAFALGLVAVANPCGLPLLPAYLSFFVGGGGNVVGRALRAIGAAACVTAGFVACFGVLGLAVGGMVSAVESAVPTLMIAAGAVMAVCGVATATGRCVRWPQLRRTVALRRRGPAAMAVFGALYGLASLGCALPMFVAAVGGGLDRRGVWVVFQSSLAYALGMGALLAVIALVVATAGNGPPRVIRAAGRWGPPLAGALLAVSGTYLAYFWATAVADPGSTPTLVAAVNRAQAAMATWLTANARWLGLGSGIVVLAVLGAGALTANKDSRADHTTTSRVDDTDSSPTPRSPATACPSPVAAESPQPTGSAHV